MKFHILNLYSGRFPISVLAEDIQAVMSAPNDCRHEVNDDHGANIYLRNRPLPIHVDEAPKTIIADWMRLVNA